MMRKDIRRHCRVSVPGAVRLSWQDPGGTPKFARGRCIDVSLSGMCLELPEPIPVRSYVIVQADAIRFASNASVRHCARAGGKYVVGLEFSVPLNVSDPKTAAKLFTASPHDT